MPNIFGNYVIIIVVYYVICAVMARRSVEESQIRSLTRIAGGKSFAITIPMEYIKALEWQPRQRLIVKLEEGKLIVSEYEENQ